MSCTVTLSAAAPAGGAIVAIASAPAGAASGLSVPTSVTVAAGNKTAIVGIGAGGWITSTRTVTFTASLNGSSASVNIQVIGAVQVTSVTCPATPLTAGSSIACTVTLSKAAPASGALVSVAPSVSIFTVPRTIVVPSGALKAVVTVGAGTIYKSLTFTLKASLNGSSAETTISAVASAKATSTETSRSVPTTSTTDDALGNSALFCREKSIRGGEGTVCELHLDSPGAAVESEISIEASSANLKTPRSVTLRVGERLAHFEIAAALDAVDESVTMSARLGDNTVRTDLALVRSALPLLDAPRAVNVKAGAAVRFRVVSGPFAVKPSGLPAGASFDPESGWLEWLPSDRDLGTYEITFSAAGPGESLSKTTVVHVGSGLPAVTNVRSYAAGSSARVCSPGSPATIIGRFLSPSAVPVENPAGDSTELGGARVRVGADYARLLSASAERVDFICPMAPAGTPLEVSVETSAGRSSAASIAISTAAPGILTVSRDGKGQALAFREGAAHLAAIPGPELDGAPAAAGDILAVFVTGIDCSPNATMPLLRLGDQYALAKSVAPLSGHASVCRVDVQVPGGIPSGRLALTLELPSPEGNLSSNTASVAIEN